MKAIWPLAVTFRESSERTARRGVLVEPNFIEEVAKALDTLSVERLVRDSLPGKVRCRECDKWLFTAIQARYTIIRALDMQSDHFESYECPIFEGLYHLSSLDKQLVKQAGNPWLRRKIEQEKAKLEVLQIRKRDISAARKDFLGKENLVVVDGRTSSVVPYTKALRRKIVRALVVPLQGMRKPRTHRFRKRRKPFRPTPRRDTARGDLPRGEIMTKMLAWPNGKKIWGIPEDYSRKTSPVLRRRNRAREAEAVRKLVEQEGDPIALWYWRSEDFEDVWANTNDAALGTIDFQDGRYTCE